MAFRTGVPRRESQLAGSMGTSATSVMPEFDEFGDIESASLFISNRKELNNKFDSQHYNPKTGITVKRWGYPGEQQFEQAVKIAPGSDTDDAMARETFSTAGSVATGGDTTPPVPDSECCSWLHISAPNSVASGSTSGVNAGGKKGCVYYWSIEGCNPSYWGCGSLAAAGTGGSGAGLHQTSQGMVFIAPTIPDAKTINCGRTVDTKIKVAVLTADGKKQLAASVGTAGWSGFGMGPGDELYDLFGPEDVCNDTANITTVADPCNDIDECATAHIDYATLSLTFYESLVLSVGNSVQITGDHVYMWTLSGVGAFMGVNGYVAYGNYVTFKAPGFIQNCTNYSATVNLFCDGVKVDTVVIGIRGIFPDPVPRAGSYYWLTPAGTISCGHPYCPPGTCYWAFVSINGIEVDCNGKMGPYTVMGWNGWACQCSTEDICLERYPGEYPCFIWNKQYGAGGCCPDTGGTTTC